VYGIEIRSSTPCPALRSCACPSVSGILHTSYDPFSVFRRSPVTSERHPTSRQVCLGLGPSQLRKAYQLKFSRTIPKLAALRPRCHGPLITIVIPFIRRHLLSFTNLDRSHLSSRVCFFRVELCAVLDGHAQSNWFHMRCARSVCDM
jgi:hypothetical protein